MSLYVVQDLELVILTNLITAYILLVVACIFCGLRVSESVYHINGTVF
jgi:hypothetical protein